MEKDDTLFPLAGSKTGGASEQKEVDVNMVHKHEKAQDTPLTLGILLRNERESKGLELQNVAQRLRIKEMYLEALETGNYTIFPGLVYGSGFLRSYALFLGLNEKEVLKHFKEETSHLVQEPVEMPIPTNTNVLPSKKLLVSLFAFGCIAYAFWYVMSPGRTHEISLLEMASDAFVTESVQPTKEVPVEADALLVTEIQQQDVPSQNAIVENIASSAVVPTPSENQAVLEAVVVPQEPIQKTVQPQEPKEDIIETHITGKVYGLEKPVILSFVATEKVWVEVKENGRVIFNRVLQKGDGYNPTKASEKMTMRVGNAGAVSVYVNGKYWDVLGRKNMVKKDISLNPDNYKLQH